MWLEKRNNSHMIICSSGCWKVSLPHYKNNDDRLRDELLCFKVLLERIKRLPEENLQRVLRRIYMFDPLLEEDPWIQEIKARE